MTHFRHNPCKDRAGLEVLEENLAQDNLQGVILCH